MSTTPNRGYSIPDPALAMFPQLRDSLMQIDADIAGITGGGGGVVTSVFGRTGVVTAQTNDYTWAQINKATSSLADITTRSAGDLTSGTLPDGRFPATLPAISGVNLTNLNASNLASGTVAAARMPALTGDITTSAGSVATAITNNAVSLAKLADIATASFLGRNTAGTGDPEVLSIATVKTMLGLTGTNSGDVTLAGENYLSLAGQVITANAINLSGTNVTATLPVTKGGSGTATQFTVGSVVFAGASGIYTQDNANLFWDDSNNRLGINQAIPTAPLHIGANSPAVGTSQGMFLSPNLPGTSFDRCAIFAPVFSGASSGNKIIAYMLPLVNNAVTQATAYGIYLDNPILTGSGTITNYYPLIAMGGNVGIGVSSPTQLLEVAGNVFVNATTANLYLKDNATGWQSASSTVITPQASNAIRSTNYTSGLIGWNISALGNAEFNNVDVRGAIHAAIITYNAIAATAGTLGVFKSAAKLRADVTVPSGPTYGTTTVNIDVVDPDGLAHASSQVFAVNDILRLKDGLVGDTWFKISSASDQTTFWRYTAIIMAGSNNVMYRAGLGVADYGLSGQGFIIQTADQTNSPYLQMATHPATFTSQDAGGTLNVTPRLRVGNLNGSYGYAADIYGFGAGQYGTAGQSWLTVDPANGVRIGNNTTVLSQVDAAGNASFTGSITASSGTIAGWTINPTVLSSGTTHLAAGFNIPAGQVAWFGKGAAGFQGTALREASGKKIDLIVGNGSIYPYAEFNDGTRPRIVIGGLNAAWGSDGSTNSMGMKIWSAAGVKLVEFSDVQNMIAGWTMTASSLSSGTGATTVAMDSGGTNPALYAGSATPASAPFRVTNAGALTATSATITGAITATSGSITGLLTMSGASSALAIGSTPPTSASAGTGIWLDRTGLYGLSSGTAQAKLDATNGKITAGAGNVTLDANGISITAANASTSAVKWTGDADITEASISSYDNGGPIIMDQRLTAAGSTNDARMLFTVGSQSGGTGIGLTLFAKPADSASWAHFNGTLFKGVGIGLAFNAPQPAPVAMLETYTNDAADTVLSGEAISRWRTTGTPGAGMGVSSLYRLESAGFTMRDAARIGALWTTATDASRTAVIVFQTVTSAAALTEVARIGQGLQMGAPTGGDKGAGTINVAGDIYKNNSAYGNPDYVLEWWATGQIVKYADKPGASSYAGPLTLDNLRQFISTNFHLPRFGQDAGHGLFSGSDAMLTALEEAYIYIFELEERIKRLEAVTN